MRQSRRVVNTLSFLSASNSGWWLTKSFLFLVYVPPQTDFSVTNANTSLDYFPSLPPFNYVGIVNTSVTQKVLAIQEEVEGFLTE